MEGEAVKAEKREALERLAEENPEALLLDGFEEAFVGHRAKMRAAFGEHTPFVIHLC